MKFDWQTFFTSIAGSAAVAGAVGYAIKRTLDQAIKAHFERASTEHKALVQEGVRRDAFLYDKQYEVLRLILSLTYRLRNLIREFVNSIEANERFDAGERVDNELFDRFRNSNATLVEVLYDERAILPAPLFKVAHGLKNDFQRFDSAIRLLMQRSSTARELKECRQEISNTYKHIDDGYAVLVKEVQSRLGLVSEQDAWHHSD